MKQENGQDSLRALRSLLTIPQKILSFENLENITEFVLHELCHDNCLNLERAAYFVDNPDFNYFKGITGVDRAQQGTLSFSLPIWDSPESFILHMRNSPFNEKVRSRKKESVKENQKETFVRSLGSELSLIEPALYSWDMKHGNRGFLLYQPSKGHSKELSELVAYAVCFLGLCPLF